MGLFEKPRRKRATDRRAGKVPHVGKVPRSRRKDGTWRPKRADAGTARPKKRSVLDKLLGS